MKIAVITAMPEESRAVADGLGSAGKRQMGEISACRFNFAGHLILLAESGMGFDNAAMAAKALIHDGAPDLLISTGFCGGIDPELLSGDVVVAKSIVIAKEGSYEEIPALFSPVCQAFVTRQRSEGNRTVEGTFVSTPEIMQKRSLAAVLPGHYTNPVVEMESAAVAIIAAENNIPLVAIRAVSDPAAEELKFSLNEFCDPEMRRINPYKVLATILKRPYIVPQLIRLSRGSSRAAGSLTDVFPRLFQMF